MIEWKETNGDFTAVCSYDTLTESYTVEVTHSDGRKDSELGFDVMNPIRNGRSGRPNQSVNLRRFVLEWRTKNDL